MIHAALQYMLLSNTPPFHGATEDELIERIFEAKVSFTEPVWENVSPEAKSLIRKLLTVRDIRLIDLHGSDLN